MEPIAVQGSFENQWNLQDLRVPVPESLDSPDRLDGASFLSLVAWLGARKATGAARVHLAQGRRFTLGVAQGSLLSIEEEGRPFADETVAWLVQQRLVTPTQLEAARANPSGKPLMQALFEMRFCTPQNLVEALKATKERLLKVLCEPGQGTFAWQDGATPRRSDPVVVDLPTFVVETLRLLTRGAYASDMDPLLQDVQGRYVYRTDALSPAACGLLFQDKEQKVLDLVADGTVTLKEGIAMSLLSRTQTDRLFLIAAFLGLVEFRLQGLPKGGIEALETRLKSDLERLKTDDYFQRLGLHWTTHPKHYDDAYRKMLDRWGPAASVRRHSPRCAEIADQAQELMDQAYNAIRIPLLRNRYRMERFGKETLKFGTDFLYKQAHLALFREDWELAQEIIESALDVVPRTEFQALRARVLRREKSKD